MFAVAKKQADGGTEVVDFYDNQPEALAAATALGDDHIVYRVRLGYEKITLDDKDVDTDPG